MHKRQRTALQLLDTRVRVVSRPPDPKRARFVHIPQGRACILGDQTFQHGLPGPIGRPVFLRNIQIDMRPALRETFFQTAVTRKLQSLQPDMAQRLQQHLGRSPAADVHQAVAVPQSLLPQIFLRQRRSRSRLQRFQEFLGLACIPPGLEIEYPARIFRLTAGVAISSDLPAGQRLPGQRRQQLRKHLFFQQYRAQAAARHLQVPGLFLRVQKPVRFLHQVHVPCKKKQPSAALSRTAVQPLAKAYHQRPQHRKPDRFRCLRLARKPVCAKSSQRPARQILFPFTGIISRQMPGTDPRQSGPCHVGTPIVANEKHFRCFQPRIVQKTAEQRAAALLHAVSA